MSDPQTADDPLIDWMKRRGIAVTRRNYIDLMFAEGEIPKPWTAQDEESLPEELRDFRLFNPKS